MRVPYTLKGIENDDPSSVVSRWLKPRAPVAKPPEGGWGQAVREGGLRKRSADALASARYLRGGQECPLSVERRLPAKDFFSEWRASAWLQPQQAAEKAILLLDPRFRGGDDKENTLFSVIPAKAGIQGAGPDLFFNRLLRLERLPLSNPPIHGTLSSGHEPVEAPFS